MTTVARLIEQLKDHDPNETIQFQYMLREWFPDMSEEEWDERNRILDKTSFADEMSATFRDWIYDMDIVALGMALKDGV